MARWGSLGGVLSSAPSVVVDAWGRLVVCAYGINGRVWARTQTGPGSSADWTGWTEIGRSYPAEAFFIGRPSVIRNADGRIELFMRSRNNTLWHIWQETSGGEWSRVTQEGRGECASDPAIALNDNGRLEVVAGTVEN
jgi:hypothetical protein